MAATFALDLRKFADSAGATANRAVRETVIEFAGRLIDRTPVGMPETWKRPAPAGYAPGQARANWQLTIESPADGTIMAVDPSGSVTKEKIAAAVPWDAAGKVYFLRNNLPYAWPLETGWSNQAPFGMAGVTTLEFNLIVSQSVVAARSGSVAEMVSA